MKKLFNYIKKIKEFLFPSKHIIEPSTFNYNRVRIVSVGFIIIFTLLSVRAIVIHLFSPSSQSLQKIASNQYNQPLYLSKYRGTIFDRRDSALALSIKAPSVFINPKEFRATDEKIEKISKILKISKKEIISKANKNSHFAWIKRKISFDQGVELKNLKIEGLYQITEPARYYPEGSSLSNFIGIVGTDDNGLFGLEKEFDSTLKGEHTKVLQTRDARGKIFYLESQKASPTSSSKDIYLTIDKVIQQITEQALAQGIQEARAKGGFAIVSDPHTGKILALSNHPNFDPSKKNPSLEATRNKILTDIFEPGSVIKPLIASYAIEKSKTSRYALHDCEEGKFSIGRVTFQDSHKPATRFLTTEDTIVTSSNVCAYKIGLKLGEEGVYDALTNFGISKKIESIGFPALSYGRVDDWKRWKPIRFANISFGQGVLTTALELVRAYSAIANGGRLVDPYYFEKIGKDKKLNVIDRKTDPQFVISSKTSQIMKNILKQVIEKGATAAKLDHYTAGGKTGTTQKVDPITHAYSKTKYHASFMGIAPIEDPFIVVYVQIDEPNQKVRYGSKWAAPVFKNIAEATLKYLNVPYSIDRTDQKSSSSNLSSNHSLETKNL